VAMARRLAVKRSARERWRTLRFTVGARDSMK
jgi:hypothetical protein